MAQVWASKRQPVLVVREGEESQPVLVVREGEESQDDTGVFMSHTYAMSVRSPMSDIAVINHSDCKNLYAWVTHRTSHSYVRSTATT